MGWKRSDYVVSTKIFWGGSGPNDKGLSRKHIVEGTRVTMQPKPGRFLVCSVDQHLGKHLYNSAQDLQLSSLLMYVDLLAVGLIKIACRVVSMTVILLIYAEYLHCCFNYHGKLRGKPIV